MPYIAPNTHSQPSRNTVLRSLIHTCWPRIRVESAQVTRGATSDCVRAVVQLGGLTPADVRVEIVPASQGGGSTGFRLFSSHALGNGCFVFEATVPERDVAKASEWAVRIRPTEAIDEPQVEFRFRPD
jgi:hypothetical protein